jgi:DNA-binding beta-propeller fold protein YncE
MMKYAIVCCIVALLLVLAVPAYAYHIQTIATLPLSEEISSISINPVTGRAIVLSKNSNSAYVIDETTGTLIGQVPLPDRPLASAIYNNDNMAYILLGKGQITAVDLEEAKLAGAFSVSGKTYSLSIDNKVGQLILGLEDSVVTWDMNGPNISEFPMKGSVRKVFASDGAMIVVLQAGDAYSLASVSSTGVASNSVSLEEEPATVSASFDSGVVLAAFGDGTVSLFNVKTLQSAGDIKACQDLAVMDINPLTATALVAGRGQDRM